MRLICQTFNGDRTAKGESWLAAVNGQRVVIDLGSSELFGSRAASFAPDILILTHDDRDHIGGAEAYFRSAERFVDRDRGWNHSSKPESFRGRAEVWVPVDWWRVVQAWASWADRESPGPTRAPRVERPAIANDVEHIYEHLGYSERAVESDGGSAELPLSILNQLLDHAVPEDELAESIEPLIHAYRGDLQKSYPGRKWTGSDRQVARRVASTAMSVARILRSAYGVGATIKFFDVDAVGPGESVWKSAGRPGVATIINAVEVDPPQLPASLNSGYAFMLASRITIQNRRSLATFLWPSDIWRLPRRVATSQVMNHDGAIIWSDGEGEVGSEPPNARVVPWRWASVMSAPHHASARKEHEAIWEHCPPSMSVILSSNSQPNSHFWSALSTDLRDCTACAKNRAGSDVMFESTSFGSGGLAHSCSEFDR